MKENIVRKTNDVETWLKWLGYIKVKQTNKCIKYLQCAASLDIETSSFRVNDEKQAILYLGAIDIKHNILYFRTWQELIIILEKLTEYLELYDNKRIIIYVHNLSYEFQFMRKWFVWDKIFALEERKVVYAIMAGIEFRCSYILTGYSLKSLAIINKLPVEKLDEEFDYYKIRTPITQLTDEYNYLCNDVEIIIYYIEKLLEQEINIGYIPITKTAYVRRYTKRKCKSIAYRKLIEKLTLTPEIYEDLKKAFSGGFTHANMYNSKKIIKNVDSFDFISSYPYVIVSEKFPMSKGTTIINPSEEKVQDCIRYYCCLITIEYTKLEAKPFMETPLSQSKCDIEGEKHINNGRILYADKCRTVITEQDYNTVEDFYNYESARIDKITYFYKQYLPKEFIESVLKLYEDKTKLKGIEERENEYMTAKEMLNSEYGMMVTDIMRDEIIYEDDWESSTPSIEEAIEKYNKSKSRFLYYPWGVWVTAYARRNLFRTIYKVKDDFIYADTDSIKITNSHKYKHILDEYNKEVISKLEKAMKYHNLSIDMIRPKNSKNEEKIMGLWEHDATYSYFKTLGAKRYAYITEKGNFSITVSGINKLHAIPYMLNSLNISYTKENMHYKLSARIDYEKILNMFDLGLYIPQGYTGKNIHTYIDDEIKGTIKDYYGIEYSYYERSCIHMEEADYELSLAEEYVRLLLNVKESSFK